jgi:hypothetical protein
MTSIDRPLMEFARLVADVAFLSVAMAILVLLARAAITRQPEAVFQATQAPVAVSDPPTSPVAAAARARDFVKQSLKGDAAKILEPVKVLRIGGADDRPRYEAEVLVEAPPGFGTRIRSDYLVTLQYAGESQWQMDDVRVSTKFSVR